MMKKLLQLSVICYWKKMIWINAMVSDGTISHHWNEVHFRSLSIGKEKNLDQYNSHKF